MLKESDEMKGQKKKKILTKKVFYVIKRTIIKTKSLLYSILKV